MDSMTPKGVSYSFSWTQKYNGWTAPQIYQDLTVQDELKQLDTIDKKVEGMTEFPEIKALLKRLIK